MHNQRYQRRLMTLARTGKSVPMPEPKPKPVTAPRPKVAKPKSPTVMTELTPEIRAMVQSTAEELKRKIVALEQKRWEARGPEWHAMHEQVLAEPKITATGVVKTGIFLTLYTAGVVHLAGFPAMWTHEAYAAIKEKITGREMPSFEERFI